MLDLIVAGLEIFIGCGIIGFWIYFFTVENNDPNQKDWYLKHERSFPLPDLGWITPCLFVAAYGLITGDQKLGIFFTILSGSAMIFLGLIDLLFSLQQGIFKTKDFQAYINIVVVLITLIFAVVFSLYGWFNFSSI
ncbi:MAG: hypothetical protein GF383_13275 [Candidatus Lokiarchaeota archaeon]|nr:hypothetical protein [Candidatus Lokiarchaeota archaeon]MBD3342145.1 hypothetical protein [Candidatus Lokiarchaeota archaeon]